MIRKAVPGIMLTLLFIGMLRLSSSVQLVKVSTVSASHDVITVSVLVDYGNGTTKWRDRVILSEGSAVFNATRNVANVEYAEYNGSIIVNAIDSVWSNSTFYWSWWCWNFTESNWVLGLSASNNYILHHGEIIAWHYAGGFPSSAPSPPPPRTIEVPTDYTKIQEAVDVANTGDTIFVHNGTYYENLVINKPVSLVGENREATIIDGNKIGTVIYIERTDNISISEFTIGNSLPLGSDEGSGIYLKYSSCNNTIRRNIVTSNGIGIYVRYDSDNNTITGNEIRDNGVGIILDHSSNNNLTHNRMIANSWNLDIEGILLSHFCHNIETSNTVNNKPVQYLANQKDFVIDDSTFPAIGYLGIVNSTNITVRNLTITNDNGEEILFAFTTNSRIEGMNVSTNGLGVSVVGSDNNTIVGNIFSHCGAGLNLDHSGNNSVLNNTIASNDEIGIIIYYDLVGNVIKNNRIENNLIGIQLTSTSKNQIIDNVIASNAQIGMNLITDCENNTIYHNNFINNEVQVSLYPGEVNTWDDGYPYGGNYWSDYNGTDANQDGIGDTPYVIDANNTDHYPLMTQYIIPEFPSFLILPLFMMATMLAVVVCKRKRG